MRKIKDYGQLREEYSQFSENETLHQKDKIILEKKLSYLKENCEITYYDYALFHAFVLNDHGRYILNSYLPEIIMRRVYYVPRHKRFDGRDDVWLEIQNRLAETYNKLLEENDGGI